MFALTINTFAAESVESLISKALAQSNGELQAVEGLSSGRSSFIGEPTLEFENVGSGKSGTNFHDGKQKWNLDFKLKNLSEIDSQKKLVSVQKETVSLLKDEVRARVVEQVYLIILQGKYLSSVLSILTPADEIANRLQQQFEARSRIDPKEFSSAVKFRMFWAELKTLLGNIKQNEKNLDAEILQTFGSGIQRADLPSKITLSLEDMEKKLLEWKFSNEMAAPRNLNSDFERSRYETQIKIEQSSGIFDSIQLGVENKEDEKQYTVGLKLRLDWIFGDTASKAGNQIKLFQDQLEFSKQKKVMPLEFETRASDLLSRISALKVLRGKKEIMSIERLLKIAKALDPVQAADMYNDFVELKLKTAELEKSVYADFINFTIQTRTSGELLEKNLLGSLGGKF